MLLCSVLKVLSDIFPPDLRLLNHCYRPNVTFSTSVCYFFAGARGSDLLCLGFSRRACTQVRSELMAAIYDKTLKRQDFSGIVNKDNEKAAEAKKSADSADAVKVTTKADKAKAKAEEDKANDPRAGAGSSILPHLFSVLKHPSQTREKSKTSCRTTLTTLPLLSQQFTFLPAHLSSSPSVHFFCISSWYAHCCFFIFHSHCDTNGVLRGGAPSQVSPSSLPAGRSIVMSQIGGTHFTKG